MKLQSSRLWTTGAIARAGIPALFSRLNNGTDPLCRLPRSNLKSYQQLVAENDVQKSVITNPLVWNPDTIKTSFASLTPKETPFDISQDDFASQSQVKSMIGKKNKALTGENGADEQHKQKLIKIGLLSLAGIVALILISKIFN